MTQFVVAAFYQFTALPDFADYQDSLNEIGLHHQITGTILLASEGINGTISGTRENIGALLNALRAVPGCENLEHKESYTEENPFYRLKVRLKNEIVTMGVPAVDPTNTVGTYIDPKSWNNFINDPDVLVIDTRNDYEVSIGTFEKAENPKTKSFREFPKWVNENRERLEGKKIAMFCTGGIRCEKATSYLKQEGMDEVYHLKGGILKYLEHVPEPESLWKGECFVFDQRVSVGAGLKPGSYDMCHACRMPIDERDKATPQFTPGVSCPHCHDANNEAQKKRFAERQKQIELSKARGEDHMGKTYDRFQNFDDDILEKSETAAEMFDAAQSLSSLQSAKPDTTKS